MAKRKRQPKKVTEQLKGFTYYHDGTRYDVMARNKEDARHQIRNIISQKIKK